MDHNQATGYNWVWPRTTTSLTTPTPTKRKFHYDEDSWEEQAFAEDAAGLLGSGGCVWPPRSYTCSFCRREFRSAQALGGHMNVHRRDRARLKQLPPNSPQDREILNLRSQPHSRQQLHQSYNHFNPSVNYKDPNNLPCTGYPYDSSCTDTFFHNYPNPNNTALNRLSGLLSSSPSTREVLSSNSTGISKSAVSLSWPLTANSPASPSPSLGENRTRMVTAGDNNFQLSSTRPTSDHAKSDDDYRYRGNYNHVNKVENMASSNKGIVGDEDKEDSCGKSDLSINLSLVVLRNQGSYGDGCNKDDADYCNSSKRRKIGIASSSSLQQLSSPIFKFTADGRRSSLKSNGGSREVIITGLSTGSKCRPLDEIDLELRIGG